MLRYGFLSPEVILFSLGFWDFMFRYLDGTARTNDNEHESIFDVDVLAWSDVQSIDWFIFGMDTVSSMTGITLLPARKTLLHGQGHRCLICCEQVTSSMSCKNWGKKVTRKQTWVFRYIGKVVKL